jgi:hypothetical protein
MFPFLPEPLTNMFSMVKNVFIASAMILAPKYVEASEQEAELRHYLFEYYDKNVRPVDNIGDNVSLTMGIAAQTLESFNQKEESIMLNIWLRMNWIDTNLDWDESDFNVSFLAVNPKNVWVPDIELLNAAALPELYTLEGGMMLNSNGEFMWSRPGIFKFSCQLELIEFPFDRQECVMKFGSWIFSDQYLDINPYDVESRAVDVLTTFSHSEWKFENVYVTRTLETRDCCPDEHFPVMSYHFQFLRFPHYYKLSMAMTITLVVVSFIIMLMEPDNVSRTGTAVFIPLTILALQLTISNKIPVVGYFTLMDEFFLLCFVLSMFCSIESGIIYAMLTSKNKTLFNLIKKHLDPDTFVNNTLKIRQKRQRDREDDKQLVQQVLERTRCDTIEMNCININNEHNSTSNNEHNSTSNNEHNSTSNNEHNSISNNISFVDETSDIGSTRIPRNIDFDNTIKLLNSLEDGSQNIVSGTLNSNELRTDDYSSDISSNISNDSQCSNRSNSYHTAVQHSVNNTCGVTIQKTIPYNDKILALSEYELFIYYRLTIYIKRADNFFRMILPIIFFSYMGHLLSYEKEV